MYSVYHFFDHLVQNKSQLIEINKLENFIYNSTLLSCQSAGKFPDMAIRINQNREIFTGGELIELKDSQSYTVSSFNSTIPRGKKEIDKIIIGINNSIKRQMEQVGDEINTVPIRDIFYLIRGKRKNNFKVCLIHGSFFETVKVEDLIRQAFSQILDERLEETGQYISEDIKTTLISIFSEQENFNKVRDVEKASVKIRFRIMTEVKAEANILNPQKYPEISDNTLNLVLPCDTNLEESNLLDKMRLVFGDIGLENFNIFKLKHHFNGNFLVFQIEICT